MALLLVMLDKAESKSPNGSDVGSLHFTVLASLTGMAKMRNAVTKMRNAMTVTMMARSSLTREPAAEAFFGP